MAELLKMVQAGNGSVHSDLLKSFVAKHKDSLSQSPPAPAAVTNTTTTPGGARISPPPGSVPSTGAATTATGRDSPDNANILQQERRTDNVQTVSLVERQNKDNANVNTTTTTEACPQEPDPNANMSEVAAVLEEVQGAVSEVRQTLLQQVTEATVAAHLATCINTHGAVKEARTRFMAMKEAGQLPDPSKVAASAGAMWEKMTEQMMPEMGKTIKFCKMLPGFNELCMEDQMCLIKHAIFEVMMTRFTLLIDHEKETMLDPSHKMVVPRQVVQKMPMGKFLDGFFHVGSKFNPVGLTDNELGVFSAVLVFSPSRPGLTDHRLVATIQSLYQQALFALIKQNHSDPEKNFTDVLSLLPMFRSICTEHSKALSNMKMQAPDSFDKQFPPLHKELFVQ